MSEQELLTSRFMRNRALFETLSGSVIPRLREMLGRPLRIAVWASSVGCEAFTLRFVLGENSSDEIVGLDISPNPTQIAREGAYFPLSWESLEQTTTTHRFTAEELDRYFDPMMPDGRRSVKLPYRRNIRFEVADLFGRTHSSNKYDLVLCNNLLLHLHPDSAAAAIERLHQNVGSPGALVIGGCDPEVRRAVTKRLGLVPFPERIAEISAGWSGVSNAWFREPRPAWAFPPPQPRDPDYAYMAGEIFCRDWPEFASIHVEERKRPLRIGFLTTVDVNVGDDFIREGIRAALDSAEVDYRPFYINKHDPPSAHDPRYDEVEVLKDKFFDSDLFIQSGTPVYWHFDHGKITSVTVDCYPWAWRDRILSGKRGDKPLFLNIGAGSCQPWGDHGQSFLADPATAQFAQAAGARAEVTTVRDPIAAEILTKLGVPHVLAPCPAFLAPARHRITQRDTGLIGVNLMPLGAHFDLSSDFNIQQWKQRCEQICHGLRELGKLFFFCHDEKERDFMKLFVTKEEMLFSAKAWRDYFDAYASCSIVVANRVHGAVPAAGLGVPSMILGTDTRAFIADPIGLPRFHSGRVTPGEVLQQARSLFENRHRERDRLLQLREDSLKQLTDLIQPTLAKLR